MFSIGYCPLLAYNLIAHRRAAYLLMRVPYARFIDVLTVAPGQLCHYLWIHCIGLAQGPACGASTCCCTAKNAKATTSLQEAREHGISPTSPCRQLPID